MTQEFKNHEPENPDRNGTDLFGMVKKIQQHLVFLERKIDALIQQTPSGPRREGHFSKNRPPFNPAHRHGGGKPGRGFRPDSPGHPRQERRFGQPDGVGNRSFFSKKKRFFRQGKD
jgi:hypothetical protein